MPAREACCEVERERGLSNPTLPVDHADNDWHVLLPVDAASAIAGLDEA